MKTNIRDNIKAIAGVSAFLTLCGTTALADPKNTAFLLVDMDGGGGPTQAGFLSWPVPAQSTNTYQMVLTTNFSPSFWLYSNQYTPTGAVTITIIATNAEYNIQTNVIDPFPFWAGAVQYSPNGIDRGTMTNETWGPLYEDFLSVSHDTMVGMGEDYIQLTVSNLMPNMTYEFTVWDYDEYVSDGSPGFYVAWGTQNPDPYGTNSFQPGKDTLPRLARVLDGGPWPSQAKPDDQEFAYSKSFFVTTDANGSVTVYGWEDDDTWGGMQWVPLNGFAIGVVTNWICCLPNALPIFTSIQLSNTNQITAVLAVPGWVSQITLESQTNLTGGAWRIMAWQLMETNGAGTITFQVDNSQPMNFLRARADAAPSFLERVSTGFGLITNSYPEAELLTVEAGPGAPTTNPNDITRLFIRCQVNGGTATITSTNALSFDPVQFVPGPWMGVYVLPWPITMDVMQAAILLENAGYTGTFTEFSMYWPVYPGVDEPYYYFDMSTGTNVAVGITDDDVF